MASSALQKWSPPALYVLSLMVFWGQIQNYMMRQDVAILIVAMVKDGGDGHAGNTTNSSSSSNTSNIDLAVKESCVNADAQEDEEAQSGGGGEGGGGGDFDWDEFTRGLVLSAFGYGYVTTQIIGGRLAERLGVRAVYGRCLAACGVLTILSPVAAKVGGAWAFAVVRVLQVTGQFRHIVNMKSSLPC